MTRDELIETIRLANASVNSGCDEEPCRAIDKCFCRKEAVTALTAIETAGMRVVPVVPTEAMIAAGWIDKEDVDPDDIYRAMLDAAQEDSTSE